MDNKKVVLGTPRRNAAKCGFSHVPGGNGDCKDCGEPAEPGPQRRCINCEIEHGNKPPVTSEPEKADKSGD